MIYGSRGWEGLRGGNPAGVDRRLRPGMRFNRDRRAAAGDQLAAILLRAPDAISFDDLFDRLATAEVADVTGWLAHALDRGYIEELPPERWVGRRFRLSRGGARVLAQARREHDSVA